MRRGWVSGVLAVAVMGVSAFAKDDAKSPLDFTVKSIDGKTVELNKYKGKVVLIVNTASQCGLTPQYKSLEALHEKYNGEGLSILGFPCNDFGAQEPGTEDEIVKFCKDNYDVKFDMFSKVTVKGEKKSPLYQFLTSKETNPSYAGEISWNFEKFLVGKDGQVVKRFKPGTAPDSKEVVAAIETELKK